MGIIEINRPVKYANEEETAKLLLEFNETKVKLLDEIENEKEVYNIFLEKSRDGKYYKNLHLKDTLVHKLNLKLEIVNQKILRLENKEFVIEGPIDKLKRFLQERKYINKKHPRFASSDGAVFIREDLNASKQKLEQELSEVREEYITAVNKSENSKRATKKVFKISKKMANVEKRLNKNVVQLIRLEKGQYEVLGFFGRIHHYLSNMTYNQQKAVFGVLFIIPWLIGFLIFFASPLGQTIWWSFNKMEILSGGGYSYKFIGLGNFKALFTTQTLGGSTISEVLTTSIMSTAFDLLTIIIFSLFIAVVLNSKFKGYQLARAIFFIPVVYNLTVINNTLSGAFGQMFDSELTNTIVLSDLFSNFVRQIGIGVEIIDFLVLAVDRIFSIVNKSGIQIIIFIAALQSIPKHLYEAATIEGATKYEMFWKITIPMVSPMILTSVIYTIVDSFAGSDIMQFLTVNSQGTTMATNQPGLYSAISIIYFIANALIIGIAFLLMKRMVFYHDK